MAQEQKYCAGDSGRQIPQVKSTSTSKTKPTDSTLEFAKEKAVGWKLHKKAALAEQATIRLRDLRNSGVGTNSLENWDLKFRREYRSGVNNGRRVNRIIEALNDQIKNSEIYSSKCRSMRTSWRNKVENSEVLEKGKVKNMINVLQRRTSILREKMITKNTNSVAHLVKKWTENSKDDSEQLRPELEGFEGLSVMNGDYIEKEEHTEENVLVIGDVVLNDNEKRVMTMNPKFAVFTEINFEDVQT